jgi:hypothetical protein
MCSFDVEGTGVTEVCPVRVEGGEFPFPFSAFEVSDRDGKEEESREQHSTGRDSLALWDSSGIGRRDGKAKWGACEGKEPD